MSETEQNTTGSSSRLQRRRYPGVTRLAYLASLVLALWGLFEHGLELDLTQAFAAAITRTGAQWVMYLLLALSVLAGGVAFERWRFLARREVDMATTAPRLNALLRAGDRAQARVLTEGLAGMEGAASTAALDAADGGPESAHQAALAAVANSRLQYERNLLVLGTLGNNAPFIGLFGTVLGIVKAFVDLSRDVQGGAAAVMAGISEALVATAIGLLVAIPSVVAFNGLKARVRVAVANSEVLTRTVMQHLGCAANSNDPDVRGAGRARPRDAAAEDGL